MRGVIMYIIVTRMRNVPNVKQVHIPELALPPVPTVQQENLRKLDPPRVQIVPVANSKAAPLANNAVRIIFNLRWGKPPANNVRTDMRNRPSNKPRVKHVPRGKWGVELHFPA